jgi:hypothetical protein
MAKSFQVSYRMVCGGVEVGTAVVSGEVKNTPPSVTVNGDSHTVTDCSQPSSVAMQVMNVTPQDAEESSVDVIVDWGDGSAPASYFLPVGVASDVSKMVVDDKYLDAVVYADDRQAVDHRSLLPDITKRIDVWPVGCPERQTSNSNPAFSPAGATGIRTIQSSGGSVSAVEYYHSSGIANKTVLVEFKARCTGLTCPSMRAFIQGVSQSGTKNNLLDAQWRVPNDGQWHNVYIPVTVNNYSYDLTTPLTQEPTGLRVGWRSAQDIVMAGWSHPTVEIDTNASLRVVSDSHQMGIDAFANALFEGELVRVNYNGALSIRASVNDEWEPFNVVAVYTDYTQSSQAWAASKGYNTLYGVNTPQRALDAHNAGLKFSYDFGRDIFTSSFSAAVLQDELNQIKASGALASCVGYNIDIEGANAINIDMVRAAVNVLVAFDEDGGARKRPITALQAYPATMEAIDHDVNWRIDTWGSYANPMTRPGGTVNSSGDGQDFDKLYAAALPLNSALGQAYFNTPFSIVGPYMVAVASGASQLIHWHRPNDATLDIRNHPEWSGLDLTKVKELLSKARSSVDIGIRVTSLAESPDTLLFGYFHHDGRVYLAVSNNTMGNSMKTQSFDFSQTPQGASMFASGGGSSMQLSGNTINVQVPHGAWAVIEVEM